MPADDLSGISGLDDRHRSVLEQKLGITTYYELIMADRRRIADAFGKRNIRPTLEQVSAWQDDARRMRAASIDASASAASASGWQSAATFVVAFEERGRGDALERRIVAELTEVEPEASPHQRSQWPGWACGDACQWMLERVAGPAVPAAPAVPGPVEAASPPVKTVTGPARGAEALPAIEIERAHLADTVGSTELVAGSRPVPQDRLVWVQPARLFVTLGSGASGPGACVVLQLIQLGGRKQRIEGQLDDTGRVTEVEVSGLADGEYTPSIVAWTPDGSSLPRVVKLPTVAVSGQPTAHGGPP